MVSLNLRDELVALLLNFTEGVAVGATELSFVQAVKPTAMVKAVNANLVKDFTFVFI